MTRAQESKRLKWLKEKATSGHLTKQEQLELGDAFLTPIKEETRNRR